MRCIIRLCFHSHTNSEIFCCRTLQPTRMLEWLVWCCVNLSTMKSRMTTNIKKHPSVWDKVEQNLLVQKGCCWSSPCFSSKLQIQAEAHPNVPAYFYSTPWVLGVGASIFPHVSLPGALSSSTFLHSNSPLCSRDSITTVRHSDWYFLP